MRRGIALLVVAFVSAGNLLAQIGMVYEFEPVVVYASRYDQDVREFPGNVIVIDGEDLRRLNVGSIEEVLDKVIGLDIRYRGIEGVQSDLNVRGFGFDQVLVMVDGMRVNDPQTGHHNLDIPFDVNSVERIEVIKGGNSYINGANAFGGVVNIVTKKRGDKRFSLEGWIGDNKFWSLLSQVSFQRGDKNLLLSCGHKASAGYVHNTDFCVDNISLFSSFDIAGFGVRLTSGYQIKDFGANSFYSEKFKNQRENTRSCFCSLGIGKTSSGKVFKVNAYSRYHYDHFVLDYTDPSFYENFHRKNSIGLEFEYLLTRGKTLMNMTIQVNRDCIVSSRLGNHNRGFVGIILGSLFEVSRVLKVNMSGYLNYYKKWGLKLWPGVSLSFKPDVANLLYFNVNKSFRVPTYTELYYNSPVNVGNENLKPEEVYCFEMGYRQVASGQYFELTAFYNHGRNLIDWVRRNEDEPWYAKNCRKVDICGIELSFKRKLRVVCESEVSSGIAFNNYGIGETVGYQSKYVLNNVRFQVNLGYTAFLTKNATGSVFVRAYQRRGQSVIALVDLSVNGATPVEKVELSFKVNNVFDKIYYDYPGVMLPGRWFKFGLKYLIG